MKEQQSISLCAIESKKILVIPALSLVSCKRTFNFFCRFDHISFLKSLAYTDSSNQPIPRKMTEALVHIVGFITCFPGFIHLLFSAHPLSGNRVTGPDEIIKYFVLDSDFLLQ